MLLSTDWLHGRLGTSRPCTLHRVHKPKSWVQEKHHIFPEYLQRKVWGETRDRETADICSTSHNTIHMIIERLERNGTIPKRVGRSDRALALEGWRRYQKAIADKAGT